MPDSKSEHDKMMYTGGHITPTRGFSGKYFDCCRNFF